MKQRKARILLVEDRRADQVIVERALEDGRIACDLTFAENGVEALSYLQQYQRGKPLSSYVPDIILMDINMPLMDGKETLMAIRANPELCHIPVIMLTTSNYEKDIIESYQLGVNAYLTKPVASDDFMTVIRQLEVFWLEIVVLPQSI